MAFIQSELRLLHCHRLIFSFEIKLHYLSHTAWTAPVPFWDGFERWNETVGMKRVITRVTQQHVVFVITLAAHAAHVRFDLQNVITCVCTTSHVPRI